MSIVLRLKNFDQRIRGKILIWGSHILHLDKKMYPDIRYILCDYPQPHSDGTRSALSGKRSLLCCLYFKSVSTSWPRHTVSGAHPVRLQGQKWDMPCTEWKGIWWLRIPMLNTDVPILVFAIFGRVKKKRTGRFLKRKNYAIIFNFMKFHAKT